MAKTTRAVAPETVKARTGRMVRASTDFFIGNTDEDNLTGQRVQRLVRLFGMNDDRARMIAALAWESAAYG